MLDSEDGGGREGKGCRRIEEPPYHDASTDVTMRHVNDECDPTGDVDDVEERDTLIAKAIAFGPPTRTR